MKTLLANRPQFVRTKDCVSDTVICSTGAPQGTVLAPLLFSIYTADFTHYTANCHLQKFSDDSAVVGLINNGDENEYRELNQNFVAWCQRNRLRINAGKTKELVVDFRRRKATPPSPVNIQGTDIEIVDSYKYLGVHLNKNLDWTTNTQALYKKGQSRLYLLRRLRSFGVQEALLRTFYDSVVASAIFYGVLPPLMAFFHQLRLLLWKNGLGVIRQPGWSLTLILWPLVIFIILAVTRQQFPPQMKEDCYVGPRNLPSTGFFPFLQTLMCNTDSTCRNKSRLLTPHASNSRQGTWGPKDAQRLLILPKGPPMAGILQQGGVVHSVLSRNSSGDQAGLLELWDSILSSSHQGKPNNASLMAGINSTLLGDQEALNALLDSMNLLKKSMCTMALSMINTTSVNPLTFAVVTFCQSNSTLLEVSLLTLNQMLAELMMKNPGEVATAAGEAVLLYDQLQNQTSLWESFLTIPQLLSPTSMDQALGDAQALLTNIQGVLPVIQKNFPEAGASISTVHPVLAGGINLIHYVQNWPGRDVYIALGDVVTLQNDTLSEVVKRVLQEVRIPLDKAVGLMLDRGLVRSYMCDNSSNPMWLTAACATGTVDMLLGWISPDKVAKQALLVWSKDVAPGDVAFAKRLLHSLMGPQGPGGQGGFGGSRSRRNVDARPQNTEEELFLAVGQVVLDILTSVPEVDMVVQSVLRSGLTSMQAASLTVDTVEEMMDNVLKDAVRLQKTFLTLMTNQSAGSAWLGLVLDSAVDMIMKGLTSRDNITCDGLLRPFEWLLSSESVDAEMWKAMICRNGSSLLMDWWPVVEKVQEIYRTFPGQADYNVTLPMILSEWHRLSNNTLQFGVFLDSMAKALGVDYWMDWMSENSTYDISETLQQRVFLAVVDFGEKIERSQLWPQMKTYVHMANWIINYRPGITTQPANCSVDVNTLAVHCETGLNWPQFVHATTQALMLMPNNTEILIGFLKGTVNLLQHVYGDIFKHQSGLYLQQGIPGGNALSNYLINLMNNLDGLAKKITTLNDNDVSNPNLMLPLVHNLLQSTGLSPLMPLFYSDSPLNVSTVLDVAMKLGRLNQHIFTFNETDSTLPDLEQLMIQFLSMEGNLTLPLSLSMGHTLITYSAYLRPEDVARLREAIRPYTNQTSAGLAEATLSAMELLKGVIDAPNGDPKVIVLGYVRQLQEFLVSALRLRRIDQLWLPSGQLSTAQVTDLYLVAMDLLKLVTPEGLQNLTQAGPDAAQQIVIEKMLAFLPSEAQLHAVGFLEDFQKLQNQMSFCTLTGQNCVAGVSEIFKFLEQIVEVTLAAKGNITIQLAPTNPFLRNQESLHMTTTLFSLLLSQRDAAYMRMFNQTLYFIRLVMNTPNLTISDVQSALRQSNLTLAELDSITALAGAANINDLMANIVEMINIRQCFEPQNTSVTTVQCVMGLINGVSGFLSQVPALRNETALLSLIPVIVNKTITDVVRVNFSSDPQLSTVQILNSTLANIKTSLQLIQLNSPEIMNEIRVVEGLIKLAANMQPFAGINATLMGNPTYAQKVYLEIAEWYLRKLENVTSTSSFSHLLYPFYRLTEMQVAIQLAQTDFSLFVNNQVEYLMKNLQYPIDGSGVSKIGQTVIEILRHQIKLIKVNLEIQNDYFQGIGQEPVINSTILNAFDRQIGQYLDLIHNWIRQPNVTLVLNDILQWGNSSMNLSTPGADLYQLLQTMAHFLSGDQLAYLSIINNVTRALNNALMIAEQPAGLQSDHFSGAISEAVQSVMQGLTAVTGPLPLSVRENVLGVVQDSLQLILKPDMSFASSRNISLLILKRSKSIIQQTVPKMVADYLLPGIQIATTYFQTISLPGGPNKWNEIILNEMKTVQSLLPPNSTAQAYISALINVTHFILESSQGNVSVWAGLGNASLENMSVITSQMGTLLNTILPIVMGGPGLPITIPSPVDFSDLVPVLEQIMTGKATPDTWDNFEAMLEAVLSALGGTPLWDDIPPVVATMDKVVGAVVHTMQAENAMLQSLQKPLVTLLTEIAHSVNTSRFNLSDVSEGMLLAIQLSVEAAGQANGTLTCRNVAEASEPLRVAVGLSRDTLGMWCNVSLQPLLERYAVAQTVYANLNTSVSPHAGAGPPTVNATAARIVKALHSFYQVNINRSLVTEGLIRIFSSQISKLAEQPMSPEAQAQWYKCFQDMQLRQSLASVELLSDQLLTVAPSLQGYMDSMERAASHILNNYNSFQEPNSTQELFKEAGVILLTSMNISLDSIFPMMWRNISGLDERSIIGMMKEAVRLIVQMQVFGDMPMVYQAMEQWVASNSTSLLVEKVVDMFAWWSSTQASGMDLLTQALPRMYETFRAFLFILRQMDLDLDLTENMEMFEDLVGNVIAMLGQMSNNSDFLAPMDHYLSQLQGETEESGNAYRGIHHVRRRREAPSRPMREPVDDFIDLLYIDYPALFNAISVAPSTSEIMETAHVFFSNPDLGVVMKGVTRDMSWGLNSSKEETIDAALGVLSYLTVPDQSPTMSMDLLSKAVDVLPKGLPFSLLIKNISRSLARESQESLTLMQQTIQTGFELFNTSLTDSRFSAVLGRLTSQVCALENMEFVRQLMRGLYVEPGQLCQTVIPGLKVLAQSLLRNGGELSDALFQTFIGDPSTYDVNANWTSMFTDSFGLNVSSLRSLNINITSPGKTSVQ
ncbi:uncharacterized protein ACJ7VT_015176 [Polymixia lowei]